MGGASYLRLKLGGGPIFELLILCTSECSKEVQIVCDIVGKAPCTSVNHCAAVEFAVCSVMCISLTTSSYVGNPYNIGNTCAR